MKLLTQDGSNFITNRSLLCLIHFLKIFALGMMSNGNCTQTTLHMKLGLTLNLKACHFLKIAIQIIRMISRF